MGIKGLPSLIKNVAGTAAMKEYEFTKFNGMKVAVDASLIIYQTVMGVRSTGRDLRNKRGELTSHINGILYKILMFLSNSMVPIFVFDGRPPEIKNQTLLKRKERQETAQRTTSNTAVNPHTDAEYIKQFKQSFKPTNQDFKEIQILLDLMGIPYIIAPGEADVVCSWLAARLDGDGNRYVKGVCSDDSDMLAIGGCYLFKDMLKFMNGNKKVKVISLYKTLAKMHLTMNQFQDLCVLLGCDYCDTIKQVGSKTAYKLIKEHGSLEKILELFHATKPKLVIDDECMIKARDYFRNALTNLDNSKEFVLTENNISLRQLQYDALLNFLVVKHDFNPINMEIAVNTLANQLNKLGVTRPNIKHVHEIIGSVDDAITFLPDEDDEDVPTPVAQNVKKAKKKHLKEKSTKFRSRYANTKSSNNESDVSDTDLNMVRNYFKNETLDDEQELHL